MLRRIADAEKIEAPDAALALIARGARGSFRDGVSTLDQLASATGNTIDVQSVLQLLGAVEEDALFRLRDTIVDRDTAGALVFLEEFAEQGQDLGRLVTDLLEHHLCRGRPLRSEARPGEARRRPARARIRRPGDPGRDPRLAERPPLEAAHLPQGDGPVRGTGHLGAVDSPTREDQLEAANEIFDRVKAMYVALEEQGRAGVIKSLKSGAVGAADASRARRSARALTHGRAFTRAGSRDNAFR